MCVPQQPHSIVQRRLLEGNITRLRGEARDLSSRVRSPLADNKDGPADTEERSESTADDSTEERESLEESERSLRSDEEDDSSEAGARQTAEKTEGTESPTLLTALVVQCKVPHCVKCLSSPFIFNALTLYYCTKTEKESRYKRQHYAICMTYHLKPALHLFSF